MKSLLVLTMLSILFASQILSADDQKQTGPVGLECRKALYAEALKGFMSKSHLDLSKTNIQILGLVVAGYGDSTIGVVIGTAKGASSKAGYSEIGIGFSGDLSNCSVIPGQVWVP